MTKEEVLQLIKFEDLFTGDNNADTKEWLDREDALTFIKQIDSTDGELIQGLLDIVDDAWELHREMTKKAEEAYSKNDKVANAIKKETYKIAMKQQEVNYMMIEDILLAYVDIEGMKEEPLVEERDWDNVRLERKE